MAFSFNPSKQREKIKFVVGSHYESAGVYRPCLLAALSAASFAFESSITTDKGHRSSQGVTVVEFWVQQVPQCTKFVKFNDEVCEMEPASPEPLEAGEEKIKETDIKAAHQELVKAIHLDKEKDIMDIMECSMVEVIESALDLLSQKITSWPPFEGMYAVQGEESIKEMILGNCEQVVFRKTSVLEQRAELRERACKMVEEGIARLKYSTGKKRRACYVLGMFRTSQKQTSNNSHGKNGQCPARLFPFFK